MQKPWQGDPTETQAYGPSQVGAEPAGYLWPDRSITYYTPGGTLWPHLHCGIDLGLPEGSPLVAPADGVVAFDSWDTTGFGNCIKIEHPQLGIGTLFGHLSRFGVKPAEHVTAGTWIGDTGNTGNSSGPHLHFSAYRLADHHFIDPTPVLSAAPQLHVVGPITFVHFSVRAKDAGKTRRFDGPSTALVELGTYDPGRIITCDAYMHGEPRKDYDTGKDDDLWFHDTARGWVPSAHTIGYPPGVHP